MVNKINVVYWRDDDFFIGFLEPYPDFRTQGESRDELIENLRDIYTDIQNGLISAEMSEVMEITV